MNRKIITTLVITWLLFQGTSASCQGDTTTFYENLPKYQGEWELYQVEKSGKLIRADSLNECGYKELISISSDHERYDINRKDLKVEGFQMGKTRYKSCSFDVETFEPEIHDNSCYNILISSEKDPYIWYELGEGALIKYEVSFEQDSLIFKLRKAIVHWDPFYDKMIFKRVEN